MTKSPLHVVVFLLFSVLCTSVSAQQPELDSFYYSSYQPPELNENSFERLQNTLEEYKLQHGEVKGFDERQFVFEYNYFLDRINRSGNVFYGDALSQYLNELKDWIVQRNGITTPVKIYLTDYTDLNAFTNDFGNIYVNVATIAKLDSEKELLIILAHEIGHIVSHHSRETALYSNLIKGQINLNQEETGFKLHAFSRSHEISADSIAHEFLKGIVSQSDFTAVFDKLHYSENPVYAGPVDLRYLLRTGSIYERFVMDSYDGISRLAKPYQVLNDSLSTHPSIESRKQFTETYYTRNTPKTEEYTPIGDYEHLKELAALVLLNSYLQKGSYIESLDLILKLRAKNDGPSLALLQRKVLNLLVQEKYDQSGFELIDMNIGCNDEDFIRFKQFMRSLSKTDLNLIVYDLHLSSGLAAADPHPEEITFQLFFHKNPALFTKDSAATTYRYATWSDDLQQCDWLTDSDSSHRYQQLIDSLKYGDYCFDVPAEKSMLLKSYLTDRRLSEAEQDFIQSYLTRTTASDTDAVSMADVELFLHPAWAAERFYRGHFLKSDSFDPAKKSILIQSDNLFFESRNQQDFELNYEKSLKLETQLFDLSDRYNSFSKNYSMLYGGKTTVLDNYLHKIILIWMFERAGEGKFHLSPVDDEMEKYLVDEHIDYVVYRLSVLNRNKGKGRKFNINYYEIYFDVKTGGIAYVAQIGSKQFPDRFQIEQMVYLSELNKKRKS